MQLSHDGKRNPCSRKKNWKVLNFFSPQPFFYSNWFQRNRWLCEKKDYQICKRKGDSYVGNYGLTSFPSLLNTYRYQRTLWRTVWLKNSPMVIIRAELLLEKEKIHNEIPLLLERVSPSSKVLIDNLEFHIKSRSCLVCYLLPI